MANAPSWIYSFGSATVAAPTLASLNFSQADIAGGGISLIATGTNCTGVTAVNVWGTTVTPSSTTATTVTFAAPAHAAGVTTASLTGPGGTSGTLAFESWSPVQITGIDFYLDANKSFTDAGTATWVDQSANAVTFTNGGSVGTHPVKTASVFGTLPSIRYTPEQSVSCTARAYAANLSVFAVAKWTATKATLNGGFGAVPLSIVGDTANGNTCFGASAGSINYTNTGTTAQVSRGSGLNTGTPQLIGVTQSTAGPATKHYLGTAQQGATDTTTTFSAGTQINIVGESSQQVDGWNGDIGAVVAVSAIISAGDLTKLNAWSQQRFGTP